MTSVVGSIRKTPTLSGTTWPIAYDTVPAGHTVVLFVATNRKAYPIAFPVEWTLKANVGHSIAPHAMAIYYQTFPSGAVAGSAVGTFSSANLGHGFSVILSDAQFDVVSASATEVTAGGVADSTVAAITGAAASSIYLNFVIAEFYRTYAHSGGFTATDQIVDFVVDANGGLSSALGYKTSGAGSITGGTWTTTDPYGGSPEARTSTMAIIFKPAAVVTNPTASGSIYAPDEAATSPPDSPIAAPTIAVTGSTSVSATVSGWDATADSIHINASLVTGGVPGAYFLAKTVSVSGVSMPISVTGLTAGATYRFTWHVSRSGQNSVASSQETANITLQGLYCYLYADVSALGVTGVDAQVFRLPTGTALAGASLGSATGLTFDATAVGGRARLRIPIVQPSTGALLAVNDTVAAVARKSVIGGSAIWTRITTDAKIAES
jgi:hypothetical protein